MQVRWLAEDREIVVPDDETGTTAQVDVSRGDTVDLPQGLARSLIKQGLAEAKPAKKPEPKPADTPSATTEENA